MNDTGELLDKSKLFDKSNIEELYAPKKRNVAKNVYRRVRKYAVRVAKKQDTFRKEMRKILLEYRKNEYEKFKQQVKTNPKVILFSAFDGRSYGDSPRAIYEYMLNDERFEDYTFVWAFRKPKEFTFVIDNPNTYIVPVKSNEYRYACALAKYWIYNYRIADHIYPKEDQVYIQLWHGTPLKRLGYDIKISDNAMNSKSEIRDKYKVDAQKFKYILAPSRFAGEKFISAWNLEAVGRTDAVLELGYPRNDFLINYTQADVKAIKEKLNLPDGKKYILYAPTWRDNQHKAGVGYVYETEVDFDKLRDALSDEYIILFRAHYLVANSFDFEKYKGFVYDVSSVNDVNHLYVISDLLVTDYSSVFFDYANLKRPEIFYMYDLDTYGNEIRGFYIDLDELPGPIVKTADELINAVKNADNDKNNYSQKYERFNKKFNYLDDGNASKRVVETIIEELR
ncbi:MAG: CDP-glycerol glycerophosphotransferase family protein [Clostridiales bacterium]|nr:CDP-glycerol glycerophosphotransferase family protein [Clostridiales bacterium]